nr:hypothetical protein [Methylobacterium sp. ZNC0032]
MFAALLVLVLSAGLNRARGDARWMPSWLPGRALFCVAPAMGIVALLAQPWPVALAFAGGYLFWAVFGWGHVLMRVGGAQPDRSPDMIEAALLLLPGSILPVFARMLFVLPGVIAVAWLTGRPEFWLAGVSFAALATIAYHVLFRPLQPLDWLRAELVVGAFWGVLILIA